MKVLLNTFNMKTFNQIKNISENYAKMMRDNFPLAFENENLNKILYEIVYDDEKTIFASAIKEQNKIQDFKDYVYSLMWEEEKSIEIIKSPAELLDLVGYNFYICKDKKDISQFKKYYREWEVICTFNNIEWRLSNYHIFWIVKKDIDTIQHQWNNRNRQDIYGTSCCSIQINKKNNKDISIKNRYNHWVNNCDATFSNNLDNIVEWLTQAINKEFNLKTEKKSNFEIDNFIHKDWKFIYYSKEMNNIYYWINKYYKDWEIVLLDKNTHILVDYFIIDIKNKKIEMIDNTKKDSITDLKFRKIEIIKKTKINDIKDEEWVLKIFI